MGESGAMESFPEARGELDGEASVGEDALALEVSLELWRWWISD